jgi:hypothetical protein
LKEAVSRVAGMSRFRASDAAATASDTPVNATQPAAGGNIAVGYGAFTTELVHAPRVAKVLSELTFIKVLSPLTVIVHMLVGTEEHGWSSHVIQLGDAIEKYMGQCAYHPVRVGRTAGYIY